MCWGNRHNFSWGSSTAADVIPLSLRCQCGLISREDINPIQHLQAEVARLRKAGDQLAGMVRYYLENMHSSDAHPDDLAAAMTDWDTERAALPHPASQRAEEDDG